MRKKYGASDHINHAGVLDLPHKPLVAYITQPFMELLRVIDSLEFGVSIPEAEWKRRFQHTTASYEIASVHVNRHIREYLDQHDAPALPAFHPEELNGKSRLDEELGRQASKIRVADVTKNTNTL